jgi:hypothetical protein
VLQSSRGVRCGIHPIARRVVPRQAVAALATALLLSLADCSGDETASSSDDPTQSELQGEVVAPPDPAAVVAAVVRVLSGFLTAARHTPRQVSPRETLTRRSRAER